MNSKFRPFAWLPVILAILACSTFVPTLNPEPTITQAIKIYTGKSTSTPTATSTPIPSATFTPTTSLPSPTPTQESTSTPIPTIIPLTIQFSIFEDLWHIVNDTYIYPDFNGLDWNSVHLEYRQKISAGLTSAQFYQAMSNVITRLGDEHSFFINPQQVAEKEADELGTFEYSGIGVLIREVAERHRAVILSIIPGSPADAAGLRPRDSIITVDGIPILDENDFLRNIIRGPEGTDINLVVQTPGEDPREIRLTRQRITGEFPVGYSVITTSESKRIGYILLVTFSDSTVDEQVAAALREMTTDAPLDGLILDNRMNDGGSSDVVEPILGHFVSGNLGYFVNRDQEHPFQVRANDINGSSQVPLVVLVGSGTASFGEIFSGILQDLGRAYLIGKTTDGNVEILWGYDLEDGSQLWLASETFRPLNHPGQNWEETGIIPQLTVSGDFDEFTLDNDPVVAAAILSLSGR